MLPIRWRMSALDALDVVVAYIAQYNPAAADSLCERIESSVLPLSEHPYLFRPGRVSGTREIVVHPNYIVVYQVLADCVEIVDVMHASREYP
jgi:addiction module RelE/StbE family toxin